MGAILERPAESAGEFAALAAAVHPAWHQAIIRLANVAERVCERLEWVLDHNQDNDPSSEYARNCRELVDMMLEYLDGIDPDPDFEDDNDLEDVGDDEHSLGFPDRILNQSKIAQGGFCWADQGDREIECEDEGAQCDDEGVR